MLVLLAGRVWCVTEGNRRDVVGPTWSSGTPASPWSTGRTATRSTGWSRSAPDRAAGAPAPGSLVRVADGSGGAVPALLVHYLDDTRTGRDDLLRRRRRGQRIGVHPLTAWWRCWRRRTRTCTDGCGDQVGWGAASGMTRPRGPGVITRSAHRVAVWHRGWLTFERGVAVQRIAVIGGGQMGAGIAEVSARAGCDVVVVEADEAGPSGSAPGWRSRCSARRPPAGSPPRTPTPPSPGSRWRPRWRPRCTPSSSSRPRPRSRRSS